MASRFGNNIAANVAISLGKRVLDGREIEKCAKGVDAELAEVREVLDELRWKTGEAEPCWCRVRVNGLHDDSCQRTRQLYERLEVK